LALLLKHGAALTKRPRQPYLSETIFKLESGDRCFALTDSGQLNCLGWLSHKGEGEEATIELTGFARDAACKDKWAELISHMIAEAGTPRASMTLIADGDPSLKTAAEKMGFRPASGTSTAPSR
jgi:hypothetical protein